MLSPDRSSDNNRWEHALFRTWAGLQSALTCYVIQHEEVIILFLTCALVGSLKNG